MLLKKVVVALTLAASAANVNAIPVRGLSLHRRQHENRSDISEAFETPNYARSASQSGDLKGGVNDSDSGATSMLSSVSENEDSVEGGSGSTGSHHGSGGKGDESNGGGHWSGGARHGGGGHESGGSGHESSGGGHESGSGGDGSGGDDPGNGGDPDENGNAPGTGGGAEGGAPQGGAPGGQQPDGDGESDPIPTGTGVPDAAESGVDGEVVDGAEEAANDATQAVEPAGTLRDKFGNEGFKEAVTESNGNQLVVIDVYDPRCTHCTPVGELLEKLAQEYPNVKFYRIQYLTISEDYRNNVLGIETLPTVFFYKNSAQIQPPSPIVGDREKEIQEAVEQNQ